MQKRQATLRQHSRCCLECRYLKRIGTFSKHEDFENQCTHTAGPELIVPSASTLTNYYFLSSHLCRYFTRNNGKGR